MAIGQAQLQVITAGTSTSNKASARCSTILDPCVRRTGPSEITNVAIRHSINRCCLRQTNYKSIQEVSLSSLTLRPRASEQPAFTPLPYHSYSVPSYNWRSKTIKRYEAYKKMEASQRAFSESTNSSPVSEEISGMWTTSCPSAIMTCFIISTLTSHILVATRDLVFALFWKCCDHPFHTDYQIIH